MRVVFDSNIYVSNLHFGGAIEELFKAIEKEKITVCYSQEILEEILETLKTKFDWDKSHLIEAKYIISNLGELITDIKPVSVIQSDTTDNKIVACAYSARADYIITGDKKHILPLKKFKGIPILSPRDFLSKVLYKSDY